jgi:hypothetical protein
MKTEEELIWESYNKGIVVYHWGDVDNIKESGSFLGFHLGTKKAALERASLPSNKNTKGRLQKRIIYPNKPFTKENGEILDESDPSDRTYLWMLQNLKTEINVLKKHGFDVIPYKNGVEDIGSISYMVIDPNIVSDEV